MLEKPDFKIDSVVDDGCLRRCREFLPKLREKNEELRLNSKLGNIAETIDGNIELYTNEIQHDVVTRDENTQQIVLDVGVGVYDVEGKLPDDKSLESAGITVIDVNENSMILKEQEPLITELDK